MSSAGQIIGGVVGAVVGFFTPLGPVYGAQIGMMIGGVIDPPEGPTINGPRLDDLSVQTSTYGAFIPRNYGTIAQHGNIFWLQGDALTETPRVEESGGKGGPTTTTNLWDYSATFALGLCEGPIDGIRRIWINGQLFYDAGTDDLSTIIASNGVSGLFSLYLGTDTQEPDPLIQADKGIANVPAYRGLAYIVFENLPLEKYNNSLSGTQIKVEIVKNATYTDSLIDIGSVAYDAAWHPTMGAAGNATGIDGAQIYVVCDINSPWEIIKVMQSGDAISATPTGYTGGGFPLYSTSLKNVDYALYSFADSKYVTWAVNGETYTLNTGISTSNHKFADGGDSAYILTVDGSGADILIHAPLEDPIAPDIGTGRQLYEHSRLTLSGTNGIIAGWGDYVIRFWRLGGSSSPLEIEVYGSTADYVPMAMLDSFSVTLDGVAYEIFGSVATATAIVNDDILTIFISSRIVVVDLSTEMMVSSHPVTPTLVGSDKGILTGSNNLYTYSRLRVVGDGNNFESNTFALNKITSTAETLGDIVEAECLTSSLLSAGDLDVTELTDSVRGYRIASLGALRGGIDPLRAAWPFDVVQHGYQIKFKRRGSASVATITADELDARAAGDNPGVQITNSREMDTLLPSRLRLKYIDSVREYDINEQISDRGL